MVIIIKFLDKHLGSLLCNILGLVNRESENSIGSEVRKILVVQLWGIGETILMLPSIEALREKYPNVQIPIETLYSDKYKGTTVIDGVKIVINMIWWKLFNSNK